MSARELKPYPVYKDSGVEWLGEIPAHWKCLPLKRLCTRSALYGANVPAESYELEGVRFLRTTDINDDGDLVPEGVYLPRDDVGEYLLQTGDLLFSRSGTIGRCFLYDERIHGPCAYAGYLVRFVPGLDVVPRYAFYFSKTQQFADWLSVSVISSTIGNVNGQKYSNLLLAAPPIPQQRAVAAFLDRKTAKIDSLVAKNERLIELLQEKRTALISHVVTKGLDPNVPMKDSGVEWLGEIPAHWEVRRWKYSCHVTEGQVDPKDEGYGDCTLIAPNHIESGTGRLLYTETAWEQGAISGKYIVREGDIIYSKIRPALNKVCLAEADCLCSADMYPVRVVDADLVPRFLLYFMLSEPFVRLMVDESMRVAMPKVNRDTLNGSIALVPPIVEQETVIRLLDRETARIDALVAKVREAIERLREYRTALISAAVTGKIDVRGATQ